VTRDETLVLEQGKRGLDGVSGSDRDAEFDRVVFLNHTLEGAVRRRSGQQKDREEDLLKGWGQGGDPL